MSDERTFHLGDILSVTTGRLVSPRGMAGIYDILNFMTGDELSTHQLPRASGKCKPYLVGQYPQLSETSLREVIKELAADIKRADSGQFVGTRTEAVDRWLAKQVLAFGEQLSVKPIPSEAHVHIDPLEEACDLMGGADKVYVMNSDQASG